LLNDLRRRLAGVALDRQSDGFWRRKHRIGLKVLCPQCESDGQADKRHGHARAGSVLRVIHNEAAQCRRPEPWRAQSRIA